MKGNFKGWELKGINLDQYEIGIDTNIVNKSKQSIYLKSKLMNLQGMVVLMQSFKADKYKGKRIMLSGIMKIEKIYSFSGIWIQINDYQQDVICYANMQDKLLYGTKEWDNYSVILDVPDISSEILIGVTLKNSGQLWLEKFTFSIIED